MCHLGSPTMKVHFNVHRTIPSTWALALTWHVDWSPRDNSRLAHFIDHVVNEVSLVVASHSSSSHAKQRSKSTFVVCSDAMCDKLS